MLSRKKKLKSFDLTELEFPEKAKIFGKFMFL